MKKKLQSGWITRRNCGGETCGSRTSAEPHLGILSETEDHPDALEIFRRAVAIDSSISLSTVYRTMKLLGDIGAIQRHAFEGGPSRFEHADRPSTTT